jgi:hypothetical protein
LLRGWLEVGIQPHYLGGARLSAHVQDGLIGRS